MTVADARIDRGRADVAVSEMVLDELERSAGVEQMGGDRVAQRVGRQVSRESGAIAVANETQLDLPPAQWPVPTGEERLRWLPGHRGQMSTDECDRAFEEDLLAPRPAFETPHKQPATAQVDVAATQQQHFPYAQSVVIHEREERAIPRARNDGEEPSGLVLSQVARGLLMRVGKDGQRGASSDWVSLTAPNSRKAQSGTKADPTPDWQA